MPSWKRVIVSGSNAALNSLTVSNGITGSLFGTSSYTVNAATASNITPVISNDVDTRVITANGNGTLNAEGNLIFNGQTLSVLYGVGDEGGEILLGKAATNTTLTGSGVTVDVFQNRLRFFEQGGAARGYYLDLTAGGGGASTNLASGGGTVTSVSASGTVSGITLGGGPITGTGTLTLSGTISGLTNSNLSGTAGITNANLATPSLMVGTTNIALGATGSTLAGLTTVTATSFTGSFSGSHFGPLTGTASYTTQALSASMAVLAPSYLPLAGGTMTGDIYAAGRTFQLQDLVLGVGTTFGTIKTDGGKYIGVYPTNGVESTRFLANGHVLFQNGGTYTDKGYRLQISASNSISGALQVTGNSVMTGSLIVSQGITGSLFGTASWAQNAVTASFLDSTTNAFLQNGNSFGTTALLGTNDNQPLALETSGSTRMFISSSGNVGIGTTTPQRTLDSYTLGGAFAGNNYVRLGVGANGAYGGNNHLEFSYNDYGNVGGRAFDNIVAKIQGNSDVVSPTDVGGTLIFSTKAKGGTYTAAPLERMRITSAGNVGIGTSSPLMKLDIVGSSGLPATSGTTPIGSLRLHASNNAVLDFGVDHGTANGWIQSTDQAGLENYYGLLLNPRGGNVGIGTTNPGNKLDVIGNVFVQGTQGFNATGETASIYIGDTASEIRAVYDGGLDFYQNSTHRVRIQGGTGNVGIGTTSPGTKLHLEGTSTTLRITDTTYSRTSDIGYLDSANLYFANDNGGNTYIGRYNGVFLAYGGGNVGIGTTSPAYKLDVNGNTNVNGTLTATVKSFIIDHPTKQGKKLQYGVLEGPEHSVYVRGRLTNENTIVLPDHWHALVHEDTITVNLTSIGKKQDLWVEEVNAHEIKIGSENEINCFYTVFAERKDIEKLITEFDKE